MPTTHEDIIAAPHPLVGPLCLRQDAQGWHAAANFYGPDARYAYLGCFSTVAEADARYRFAAGLADDEFTKVHIDGVPYSMTIIDGRIVNVPGSGQFSNGLL